MGRLTEMIAFINAEPQKLQEQKASGLYNRLNIGDKEMKFRRDYRKSIK